MKRYDYRRDYKSMTIEQKQAALNALWVRWEKDVSDDPDISRRISYLKSQLAKLKEIAQ